MDDELFFVTEDMTMFQPSWGSVLLAIAVAWPIVWIFFHTFALSLKNRPLQPGLIVMMPALGYVLILLGLRVWVGGAYHSPDSFISVSADMMFAVLSPLWMVVGLAGALLLGIGVKFIQKHDVGEALFMVSVLGILSAFICMTTWGLTWPGSTSFGLGYVALYLLLAGAIWLYTRFNPYEEEEAPSSS